MANSKPPSKIKSFLSLVLRLLTIAQWFPFIGRYKPLLAALSAVLGTLAAVTCEKGSSKAPEPQKTAEPTPQPTPEPTPSPKPTRPPLPELRTEKFVKAGEKFKVELCNVGNQYEVSLFAEKWRLGYMGFGDPCMVLVIALNGKGQRKLIALGPKDLRAEADVVVE